MLELERNCCARQLIAYTVLEMNTVKPPPGADFFAIDIAHGEPRDQLRTASVLANDILRIASGLADAAAIALLNSPTPARDLEVKIEGLRNRIDMLEAVARLTEDARRLKGL